MNQREAFHTSLAQTIIKQLENNTSIFSQPWNNETLRSPINAVTEKRYNGINIFALLVASVEAGYADPRWATFTQAQSQGWKVRKGARASQILFVQTTKTATQKEESRKTPDTATLEPAEEQKLIRPFIKRAYVFNALDIEGIPPLQPTRTATWNPIAEADALIRAAKVDIFHGALNQAYYTVEQDIIYLPNREQFDSVEKYYSTALHELAHATGHPSRLNRDVGKHQFGSQEYAREELRAEIASLMLCAHTGIPYDPTRHVPYIKSWIKALVDEPQEIVLACRDADAIAQCIISKSMALKVSTEIIVDQKPTLPIQHPVADTERQPTLPERTPLYIPYQEKEKAKALARNAGISLQWDSKEKQWFAHGKVDISSTPLAIWLKPLPSIRQSPQEHFAEKMQQAGIIITHAVLDGKWHRCPVEGGKPGNTDGGYIGYQLLSPHGFYQNFRTGEKGGWRYKHEQNFSRSEVQDQQRLATAARIEREAALARSYQIAAQKASTLFAESIAATNHPYLVSKGVAPFGTRVSSDGALLVPLKNLQGEITSIQRISDTGEKRFLSGGKKAGSFYELSGQQVSVRNDLFIIAEGFATAATIKSALGETVRTICAFDAGNLKPVAMALKDQYPNASIVFAADSDLPQPGRTIGVGEEKALEAAKEVSGVVITPDFGPHKDLTKRVSDFNDLERLYGQEMVKTQVTSALAKLLPEIRLSASAPVRSQKAAVDTPEHSPSAAQHFNAPKRSLSFGLR